MMHGPIYIRYIDLFASFLLLERRAEFCLQPKIVKLKNIEMFIIYLVLLRRDILLVKLR